MSVFFIVKDMLRWDRLGCEGSGIPTPAMDELQESFGRNLRCYSTAPATKTFYWSLLSGLNTYGLVNQTGGDLREIESFMKWPELKNKWKKIFVIWPRHLKGITGIPIPEFVEVRFVEGGAKAYLEELKKIQDDENDSFAFIHLPHGYPIYEMSDYYSPVKRNRDIAETDAWLAKVLNSFPEHKILFTSDHGTLEGEKGLFHYGFHTFEPVVRVPLLRNFQVNKIGDGTLVDSKDLLIPFLDKQLPVNKEIVTDTLLIGMAEHRSIALINEKFKFIRQSADETIKEHLFDLKHDPGEHCNLLLEGFNDRYRKGKYYDMREDLMVRDDWETIDEFENRVREIIQEQPDPSRVKNRGHDYYPPELKMFKKLISQKTYSEVRKVYEQSDSLQFFSKTARGLLFKKACQEGKYNEAEELAKELLEEKPYNLIFKYNLASVKLKKNQISSAQTLFKEIKELVHLLPKSQRASLHFHLAVIARREDEFEDAKKLLQDCLKIMPDHNAAQTELEKIMDYKAK